MSFIVPEFLIRSLQSLTTTQDDMQTLSLFIRSNKRDYKIILEAYGYELTHSNALHRLSLLYLANEILQTERGNDEDAVSLISGIKMLLPSIFSDTIKKIRNDELLRKYNLLGKVWIERQIFTPAELNMKIEEKYEVDTVLETIKKQFNNKEELLRYLKEWIVKIEHDSKR